MTCKTCFGAGRVKVSWSPVVGSTYKIKVHYEPCPDCAGAPDVSAISGGMLTTSDETARFPE